MSGEELLDSGLAVSLSERPAAAVITYRQVVSGLNESLQTITDQELMDYVRYLADDTLEGRATNTPGGTSRWRIPGPGNEAAGDVAGRIERRVHPGLWRTDAAMCWGFSQGAIPRWPTKRSSSVPTMTTSESGEVAAPAKPPTSPACSMEPTTMRAVWRACWKSPRRWPNCLNRRDAAFCLRLWDGEERGFVGSQYFVAHPTVALDRITCVLAIDMIGRVADNRLVVWGTGTAAGFRELFTAHNVEPQLDIEFRPFTLPLSDHQPFFVRGIPAILPSSGLFPELHRPTDDVALINADGMRRATQLLQGIVYDLANRDERLAFVEAARTDTERSPARSAAPPTPQADDTSHPLGFTYQRHPAEPTAWIVVQVTEGTPAANAGLLPADRIRAVAGVPITEAANAASSVEPPTAAVDLQIERNGRIMSLRR